MRSAPLVLARWVARTVGPDLLRHLVPPWMVLFLGIVELDVIVDFRETARVASGLPPWVAGLTAAGLCALVAVGDRRFVRDALLGPRHAVLRRQPLAGAAWGPASLVVLAPVAAPVGVGALFWYGGSALPAALAWLGLGVVAAALVAARRWAAGLAACAVAGAVVATGQQWPLGYLVLAPAVWAVAVPVVGTVALRSPIWPAGPTRSALRPRSVMGALVHRDLLAVWRTDRWIFRGAVFGAVLTGFPVGAMWINGEYPGPTLASGALVGLAFLGPLALQAATVVARSLGRRFDPPEWPVTAAQRALSLTLVAGGVLVPSWAAAAVAGPPIGVAGHLRIAAFVAATGAGAAWWVISRPSRPNPGTWPYWLGGCLVPVLVPWGSPVGWLLAAAAFGLAVRGLERQRARP